MIGSKLETEMERIFFLFHCELRKAGYLLGPEDWKHYEVDMSTACYQKSETTWCSSPKCPETNLPLLIDIHEKKLSWQWIDP